MVFIIGLIFLIAGIIKIILGDVLAGVDYIKIFVLCDIAMSLKFINNKIRNNDNTKNNNPQKKQPL